MIDTDSFGKIEVSSSAELRTWLANNHLQKESVWLVTYKKTKPSKYVSNSEILDELLCIGWIDGIRRKLDDTRTMQLISPRRVEHWTKTYKDRAEKLIQTGKMKEPGFRSIANSKESGLWDFMGDVDRLVIPEDLQSELSKYEDATTFFNTINPSSKRFVLRWIKLAKGEHTRKSRIEKIAKLAAVGEKLKGS
jgi:uncharacterized protein YdeI (YjbR/CyaY-like superfamily)